MNFSSKNRRPQKWDCPCRKPLGYAPPPTVEDPSEEFGEHGARYSFC